MIKKINKVITKVVKEIPKGTFNYRKYARSELKPINTYFTSIDYAAQLPYLKVVTNPLATVVFIPSFITWIGYQIIKETLDGR